MARRRASSKDPWPPICSCCGKKLATPGALVFSPPKRGKTQKLHLCVSCYRDLYPFMTIAMVKPRRRR